MNKKTLAWTLIVAVPVGIAALVTAYIYRDTGKLPFQKPAETVTAPEVATDGTQTAASTETPAGSQDQTTEANAGSGDAATAPAAKGPSFDVVGVEPTGETVVAGRSDAGAIVALTANGKVVGKSIANEAGEWTIILDEPLKPGDYDVGLEVHDEAGAPLAKSEEHVVVSLPEGGKEQPLVVLNTPEGPSDILQKPATEQQVAAAEPAPQAQQTAAAGTPEKKAGADETATTAAKPDETPSEATGSKQTAAQEPAPTTGTEETQVAAAPSNEGAATAQSAASSEQASTAASAEAPAATETSAETAAAAAAADAPASGATTESTQVAAVEAASTTRSVAQGAKPDGQAGGTEAAATQEVTQPVADEAGTAAVETAAASDAQPEPSALAAQDVAAAPAAESETQATEAAPAVTAEAAPAQAAQPAPAEPTVTVEAVESEKDKVYVAGTGEPGSSVRVYVGDDFQGEAQVNSSGKWLVQGSKNISEGNVEVRADLIAKDGNTVDARAAVTFEKEQDKQIVLTKVIASGASGGTDGQGAEVKKALPVVIIRKGDNLWRISRRLYGHGVRYTTIYQANQEQIRNPDLIYPGQVFLTPEGDLNWKPVDGSNG
ncbi:LysM peptidoglycan-binding domain-containing protein [Roseibium sediminicola]|uniref:LysM peptidoglycan-binding domain-containing protein n=1 Tax=Roseibium sediminicola TaxID=2933272 RepID=A0ABT0GZI1_9HYPH|nr:LysM peptidoglycan-binding domain-containing protein [Roseibium sp. CAU 1639]MCK7614248.1 LysM peptidoglycan-binding domain-containing protein [Roseibium sp. CAU 1639]